MSKEIYISSTPHETRLAIVENDELAEIYYERENEYTLAGSIYNGRVTRVLPGMQSSFVDIGLERDAFLYITDFMEEAGDSADFEATHGGGEARAPRSENRSDNRNGERGDRGNRNDRGDRGERPAPVTIEATASVPSENSGEGRSEQGNREGGRDRNGRGRNRRGRGNRNGDRNQNGDRTPVADRPLDEETPRIAEEAVFIPSPSVDIETVGEGAPGADGSRRWRGRRGRRRGRGNPGHPGEAQGHAADASLEAAPIASENAEYAVEENEPEIQAAPAQETYTGEDEPARSAPPRDGQRREGGRNDRGGRGRNDRNGRGDRNDRGPRAPRGFEPSHNLYGVDAPSGEEEASAPVEPIILPGESLSKYRPGGEVASPPATPSANVIVPKPTTVIDDFVATAWDGGAVLPGETLSRRNRPDSGRDRPVREGRSEHRQDNRQNFRNQQSAAVPQVIHDAEGLSVVSPIEEQPEVAAVAHHEPANRPS